MSFVTKIDFSDNRQVRQHILTNTQLSGTTTFGVSENGYPKEVDELTISATSIGNVTSTFTGTSSSIVFNFGNGLMDIAANDVKPITGATLSDEQNISFLVGNEFTQDGNNIKYSNYSGVSFNLTVNTIEEISAGNYTGETSSSLFTLLADALNFTNNKTWVDVKGNTRTKSLTLVDTPPDDPSVTNVLSRNDAGELRTVDLATVIEPYTYTNPEPSTETVGGILVNSTFDSVDLDTLWTRLLYKFQLPTFSSFSIVGVSSPLEVGQGVPATDGNNLTFTWGTSNSTNVSANTITIRNSSSNITLLSNLDNDGSEATSVAPTQVIKSDIASHTWQITGINTEGDSFSSNRTINWRKRVYWGNSGDASLTEAGIKALTSSTLKSGVGGTYVAAAGGYKYFCHPASFGFLSNVVVGGFVVAMENPITISLTNTYNVTEDYIINRTVNELGDESQMIIS